MASTEWIDAANRAKSAREKMWDVKDDEPTEFIAHCKDCGGVVNDIDRCVDCGLKQTEE